MPDAADETRPEPTDGPPAHGLDPSTPIGGQAVVEGDTGDAELDVEQEAVQAEGMVEQETLA